MTADIFNLDDFRHGNAASADIPPSDFEDRTLAFGQSPYATLPDPLPRNWGEFWKAGVFWQRRQATTTGPSPECWRRALNSLRSNVSTLIT